MMPSPTETIDEIVDRVFRELRPRLTAELTQVLEAKQREALVWVDQFSSPAGNRRHINLVRDGVARGDAGFAIVGRRYLASQEALAAALERKGKADRAPREDDPVAALRSKLAVLDGGQR